MLHQFAEPDEAGIDILRMAMEKLHISARTIADLEGSEQVLTQHLAEAIGYRTLDRGDWTERGFRYRTI